MKRWCLRFCRRKTVKLLVPMLALVLLVHRLARPQEPDKSGSIESSSSSSSSGLAVLHHSSNEFGPVWVYKPKDRELTCLGFIDPSDYEEEQSCVYLNGSLFIVHEYARMMMAGALLVDEPGPARVLMLGLGGGVLARAIQDLFPDAHFDIVELNGDLVRIARQFFHLETGARTRILIGDGFEFAARPESAGLYDLTLVDMDVILAPNRFSKTQRRQMLRDFGQTLRPQGVLVVNWPEDEPTSSEFGPLEHFRGLFNGTISLVSEGNRIVLAKRARRINLDRLLERARRLSLERFSIDTNWLLDQMLIDDTAFVEASRPLLRT